MVQAESALQPCKSLRYKPVYLCEVQHLARHLRAQKRRSEAEDLTFRVDLGSAFRMGLGRQSVWKIIRIFEQEMAKVFATATRIKD